MIALITVLFVTSYAITGWIRRYCLSAGIVDVPNQRSSHTRIVARGGGIGFSFFFLAAVLILGIRGIMPWQAAIGLVGGGSIVTLTGWLDDRKGLTQLTRIVLHLISAAWAVEWLGPIPPAFGGFASPAWIGKTAWIIAFAWMINLYNFMDGTDGIAGIEAVTVARRTLQGRYGRSANPDGRMRVLKRLWIRHHVS